MANQFYVAPLGGLDVSAKFTPAIEAGISAFKRKQFEEEAQPILQGGDPNQIADLMLKYPEMQQQIVSAAGYKNKAMLQDALEASREIIMPGSDPVQVYAKHIQKAQGAGEDVSRKLQNLGMGIENPETLRKRSMAFLAANDPKGWKELSKIVDPEEVKADAPKTAMQAYLRQNPEATTEELLDFTKRLATAQKGEVKTGIGAVKPTANIQDWQYYEKLLAEDPAKAARFARQVGIDETAKPELKPTTAQQNYDRWKEMPAGTEKDAFAKMIGIDPKKSPKEEREKREIMDKIAGAIDNATDTVSIIDKILDNETYINALTGIRGATPWAIPGQAGKDAVVFFDQLVNSLTLDNLNKMSGVLTDKDIEIIRSAAAGLETGMSKSVFRARLEDIKKKISRKSDRKRMELKRAGYYKQPGADILVGENVDLPPGVTEADIQETMRANNMTRDQVLERLKGM